jgi:hypothetical protein
VATLGTNLEQVSHPWEFDAVNQGSEALIVLALALALVFERRESVRAADAHLAAAAVSVAFIVIALAKLYSTSYVPRGTFEAWEWVTEATAISLAALAFGLIGFRSARRALDIAFVAAVCATAISAVYAISLEGGFKHSVWWGIVLVCANLAASAAARMRRR